MKYVFNNLITRTCIAIITCAAVWSLLLVRAVLLTLWFVKPKREWWIDDFIGSLFLDFNPSEVIEYHIEQGDASKVFLSPFHWAFNRPVTREELKETGLSHYK